MVFSRCKNLKKISKTSCLHFIRKMEKPAKRVRLALRESKLLDLDDDALIMIIEKLDHRSKKQMMASCKRFQGLIGHTHQFYKNFKFRYNQKQFLERKETHYLEMIRRMFGTVEISSGAEEIRIWEECWLEPPILRLLEKIGAHILKIKFHGLRFKKLDFWKLLKALPKVKELEIDEIYIIETDPDKEIFEVFELKHLTNLKISCSRNLEFLAKLVPSSLKILQLIAANNVHEEIFGAVHKIRNAVFGYFRPPPPPS
jgi:hypothetical protein